MSITVWPRKNDDLIIERIFSNSPDVTKFWEELRDLMIKHQITKVDATLNAFWEWNNNKQD